jgi:hypothetical protein
MNAPTTARTMATSSSPFGCARSATGTTARKAVCPDGLRLVGLSHTANRGLCLSGGPTWSGAYEVVKDESYVSSD